MLTASDLMTRHVVTLHEGDTLDDADRYAELGRIRHLPVIRGKKLVGLITHRDLLRHFARRHPTTGNPMTVGQAMTREVKTVRPSTPVSEVIRILLENKFGCLPVTTPEGVLLGILTEHDLLLVAQGRLEDLERREEARSYEP